MQALWLVLQLTSTVILVQETWNSIAEIRKSHQLHLYFDLITVFGFFVLEYPYKSRWYFRPHLFQEFFDELQDSPLYEHVAPPPTMKVVCVQFGAYEKY